MKVDNEDKFKGLQLFPLELFYVCHCKVEKYLVFFG